MNKIARKPYIAMSGNRRIQHIKVRNGFISWWVAIRVGTQGGPKQSNRKMETNYFTEILSWLSWSCLWFSLLEKQS
jgi:hypothetical protein